MSSAKCGSNALRGELKFKYGREYSLPHPPKPFKITISCPKSRNRYLLFLTFTLTLDIKLV